MQWPRREPRSEVVGETESRRSCSLIDRTTRIVDDFGFTVDSCAAAWRSGFFRRSACKGPRGAAQFDLKCDLGYGSPTAFARRVISHA